MSNKVFGNTSGLKANQITRLQKIYDRSVYPSQLISPELARYMVELSVELRRQIGVLIDRRGQIDYVMLGDANEIALPDFKRVRAGLGRFRGLRHVHTVLDDKGLKHDALVDLALLKLDLVAAISPTHGNLPGDVHLAHLMPLRDEAEEEYEPWRVLPAKPFHSWNDDVLELITALEDEYGESVGTKTVKGDGEKAILVTVYQGNKNQAEESMAELEELAKSAGVQVVKKVLQRQDKINAKTLIGKGKITDLAIRSMGLEAELLIVDCNLSASQARTLSEMMDIKVLDRTQLILDIFAQRANSRDGKIQVELAQLKYLMPRLNARDDSLSRLTGGIGSRGPGETKLEIGRRRTKEKITRLEKQLKQMANSRNQRRSKRQRSGFPIISIVGYTNAGKSTLLNALTKSDVFVEDQLFATLDTSSRRLRFPREREVIITDTVGFIRDLPKDLIAAFKATLEELEDADLLLHVIDASNPQYEQQKKSVDAILSEIGVGSKPMLVVYNKLDKVSQEDRNALALTVDSYKISAVTRENVIELLKGIEGYIWKEIVPEVITLEQ